MLQAAKARLDTLDYYPNPVDITGVRVWVLPWWFKLIYPQFDGMCMGKRTIFMRSPNYSLDLLTHELCHCWQTQQDGSLKTLWAYMHHPYRANPYEVEARKAVSATR